MLTSQTRSAHHTDIFGHSWPMEASPEKFIDTLVAQVINTVDMNASPYALSPGYGNQSHLQLFGGSSLYLDNFIHHRDLRVVITSATIDTEKFARHFADAPVIEVSGRTFPVELRYRPPEDESLGERDLQMAVGLRALARLEQDRGRSDEVIALLDEACAIYAASENPRTLDAAQVLTVLAIELRDRKRYDDAAQRFRDRGAHVVVVVVEHDDRAGGLRAGHDVVRGEDLGEVATGDGFAMPAAGAVLAPARAGRDGHVAVMLVTAMAGCVDHHHAVRAGNRLGVNHQHPFARRLRVSK